METAQNVGVVKKNKMLVIGNKKQKFSSFFIILFVSLQKFK